MVNIGKKIDSNSHLFRNEIKRIGTARTPTPVNHFYTSALEQLVEESQASPREEQNENPEREELMMR